MKQQNVESILLKRLRELMQRHLDFIHARLEKRQNQLIVHPARLESTLQSMAKKDGIIAIPEDRSEISAGEIIDVQVLI